MEWKTVKLGKVCDLIKNREKGVLIDKSNYVSTENMLPNKGGVVPSSITPYDGAIIYHPKDVLISNIRPYFKKIWFADKIGGCSGDVLCFRSNSKIDSTYLYYLLSQDSFFDYVMAGSKGTKMPRGDKGQIMQYELPLPPLETQRRIVAILSSLDDKIENNNRINRNLEAQAQALFKSWFVDFEPWGGTMPGDWKEYQLTEFAEIISGYSYKGAELLPSEDAMATIKNFDRKGFFKLDGYKEIQISGRLKNTQILNLFDVIVAHTDITQQADIIGNPAIILSKGGYRNIIMSMDLCKVQPTHYAISSAFLYCLLKDIRFKSHALGYVNGTTVLHMSKKALPEYRVFLPNDLSKVQELGDRLQNLYKRYSINLEESARLAALRDTLLPKLMKGEVIV